jgi:hypothetical protein
MSKKKLFGVSEDKTRTYRNVNNPECVPSLIPCSCDKKVKVSKKLFFSHYTAQKYALRLITKRIFVSHEENATGQTYVTETTNKSLKRPSCCIH